VGHLHFTLTAYPPSTGGAQIHTHALAKALREKGNRVDVSAFWDTNRTDWLAGTTFQAPRAEGWSIDGLVVRRPTLSSGQRLACLPFLPFHYPLPGFTTPILSKLLQPSLERCIQDDTDLIHHVRIGREVFAHASLAIARRRKIPFVLTPLHHPRWVGWRYREWLRIYREADLVFSLSEQERQILTSLGVDEKRIRVAGIAPAISSEALPTTGEGKPFILFLGQHYRYKGWRQLLQATALVWETHPEIRFVFAGPPVGNSEAAFRGLDPRIERLGRIDDSRKAQLLRDCTMLVLPSTQESFGGVFTEAWHFRKPVIGCPIPAVSELIQDGVNGLLREQTPESLAQGICFLLDHPEQARAMGDAGHDLVETRFTWEAIASTVEAGYAWAKENRRD